MQDKTIDNAPLALRKQIIRGDGENQAHEAALPKARGVPIPKPCAYRSPFKSGGLKQAVLSAPAERPQSGPTCIGILWGYGPDLTCKDASTRVWKTLTRLKAKGLVRREGRVFGCVIQ